MLFLYLEYFKYVIVYRYDDFSSDNYICKKRKKNYNLSNLIKHTQLIGSKYFAYFSFFNESKNHLVD